MKSTFYFTVILGFGLLLTSCKKESTHDDKTPPQIDIDLPAEGQHYTTNDTLFLDATITDNESEISDVSVRVLYGTDSILIWPPAPVIFGNIKSYHLDDYIINNITVPVETPATIRIYATDKRDNSSTKDVGIVLE